MLRLLKYELRKTLAAKLILLAVTFVAEAVFLYGFWGGKEKPLVAGAVLLFLIAVSGITLMGILNLVTLHRDMNTKQGYMLFMTPNSCYKILGAKVIECGISVMLAGAFYFGLGALDFSLLLGGNDTFHEIWNLMYDLLRAFRIELSASNVAAVVFCLLSSWLCTVTTAHLADVISSSLLNGKKWNLLVTFALFLALNYGISKIAGLVPSGLGVVAVYVWQGVIMLGLAGIMYVITARLMEKYLSV